VLEVNDRQPRMTSKKTTREFVYETNQDVKWICKMLQRMDARDEDFEARIGALEGWQAEKAGEVQRSLSNQ